MCRALVNFVASLWLLTPYVVHADIPCDCSPPTFLNCSARNLSSFVYAEEDCEDVNIIDVSFNQIASLEFSDWIGDVLHASHNNIEEITLSGAENLKEIDVSFNNLSKFHAEKMSNLQTLSASDNTIDSLWWPTENGCKLERVNLSGNKLVTVDFDVLHTCKDVVYFDASRNEIEDLSTDVLNLLETEDHRSITFDLRDNPITQQNVDNTFKDFEGYLTITPDAADCMCALLKSVQATLTLCVSSMCPDNHELWTSLGNITAEDSLTSTVTAEIHYSNTSKAITDQSAMIATSTAGPGIETMLPTTPNQSLSLSPLSPPPPPSSPPPPLPSLPPSAAAPNAVAPPAQQPNEPSPPVSPPPSGSQQPAPMPLPSPQPEPTVSTESPGDSLSTATPSRENRRRSRLLVTLVLTAVGLVVATGCAAALIFVYRRRRRQVERERAANAHYAMQPLINTTPRFMRNTDDFVS